MPDPLKVLIAEDNPDDAELTLMELRRAGFAPDWKRVETEADYLAHLNGNIDLILSDFQMPEFNGLRALELLKQSRLDVPFILISGTIGEDVAVTAMKQGAADYLLKDRLTRLGPAVVQALEQSRLRREHHRSEKALHEADAHLQHLVARSPTVIYSLTPMNGEGRINYVSPNVSVLTGFTVEEALRPDWWRERLHPDDREPALAGLSAAAVNGSSRTEYRLRHQDGHYVWLEDRRRSMPAAGSESAGIVGGWTDITVRKKAEEALRESVERFQQLAENIREVFWMTDLAKQEILYISPAYEIIWGRTCASLYAAPQTWMEAIRPDDRERVERARRTKQGLGTYDEEYRILRPDGTERWIRDRAFVVRDANGSIKRCVGVAEDITESKKLQEQFFRAQRMEAIGTLAGGIAHDLNNILAPVLMAPVILRETARSDQERRLLDMIEQSGKRGSNIVRQLLTFSRGASGERVSVQLRTLFQEMSEIIRETFPKHITFQKAVSRDLSPVLGDPTQLHQVLMNLCVNARDAMPDGGILSLDARNVELTAEDVASHPAAKPGPYVALSVTDTGEGIPPEIIDRIFDPFFTTKSPTKGTGLGLSTLLGIVRSHQGFTTVASKVCRGTTFTVYLPAVAADSRFPFQPASGALPRGHGELILVVDDEEPIRSATRLMLEHHGYQVETAADGAEALATFALNREAIKLVVTDVMMPVMGGIPLIRGLRALAPKLKVLATSGLTDQESYAKLKAVGVDGIIAKPCEPLELLQAIRGQLAPGGTTLGFELPELSRAADSALPV